MHPRLAVHRFEQQRVALAAINRHLCGALRTVCQTTPHGLTGLGAGYQEMAESPLAATDVSLQRIDAGA